MKRRPSKALFVPLFLILLLLIGSPAAAARVVKLFYIESSILSSRVQYSILLSDNFTIHSASPVFSYRVYRSGRTRKLNWTERKFAYNFRQTVSRDSTSVRIVLSKYPHKPITVKFSGKHIRPYITIKGKKCRLEKIYIKATGNEAWPSVKYARVTGFDTFSGEKLTERIDR